MLVIIVKFMVITMANIKVISLTDLISNLMAIICHFIIKQLFVFHNIISIFLDIILNAFALIPFLIQIYFCNMVITYQNLLAIKLV